jgi:sulfate transport system ATP-binding protein
MTVQENIAYGLKVRGASKAECNERVSELVKLVSLEGMEGRFPSQLSGGQRQRVALARALAPHPRVLLLDEPFGAVDAKVREELREWIVRLHEQTHVTTIFVTHDQHEALDIANQIFVMNRGRIEQAGGPIDIFDRPASEFVAQFVGESNFIESAVSAADLVTWGPLKFSVNGYPIGQKVRVYFRPHDVYLSSVPETLQVTGKILKTRFRGQFIEYDVAIGEDREIVAHVPKGVALASGFDVGRTVYLGITGYQVFPIESSIPTIEK